MMMMGPRRVGGATKNLRWLLAVLVIVSVGRILSQGQVKNFVDTIAVAEDNNAPQFWDALIPPVPRNSTLMAALPSLDPSAAASSIPAVNHRDASKKNPKFAYAFAIWNVNLTTDTNHNSYGPYLANILISTKLLKQWGSQADFVLLVRLQNPTKTHASSLLPVHVQMLQKLGIRIMYLDVNGDVDSVFDDDNSKQFGMFTKFHVWNLTDYDRVLYLDSDVLPLQNLDYLMEHSYYQQYHQQQQRHQDDSSIISDHAISLQSTIVVAGWMQPASGGFFVVTPNANHFGQLQSLIRQRMTSDGFDPVQGWGHVIEAPDQWETNLPKTKSSDPQTNWTFVAAEYDQGLLYHFAKYVLKNVTQILATKVVNYGSVSRNVGILDEWTLSDSLFSFRPTKPQVPFWPDNCARMMTVGAIKDGQPFKCVAPYSDWSHFTGETKPWLQREPARSVWHRSLQATTASEVWWKTLRGLYREDRLNITQLGLKNIYNPVPFWMQPLVYSPPIQVIAPTKLVVKPPNASIWTDQGALGEWKPTTSSTFLSLSPPKSRFAYVFMIWNCEPDYEIPGYRPYLANMMISAKLLHEKFGSESDVVAMIKLKYKSNYTRLLPEDEAMLETFRIRIIYLPKTPGAHGLNGTGISDMMNKFMVWNLTEYQRVLYLDSDVMPLTNLDYLFHLSVQGILKPTVVVAGYLQPANGGFVVLEPNTTDFNNLQHIINTMPRSFRNFDIVNGFGHKIEPPDLWETNRRSNKGRDWTFYAAHLDQGLLYHYPKYVKKALTNIFSRKIVNFGADANGTVYAERVWMTPSLNASLFANVSQRVFDFDPGNCNKVTGRYGIDAPDWPGCVPPYSDYHHFTGGDKPWKSPPPRNVWVLNRAAFSSNQMWWQMIREMKVEDGIDITKFGLMVENPSAGKKKKEGAKGKP